MHSKDFRKARVKYKRRIISKEPLSKPELIISLALEVYFLREPKKYIDKMVFCNYDLSKNIYRKSKKVVNKLPKLDSMVFNY